MRATAGDPLTAVQERVKTLPPLPLVVRELMRVMSDHNCSNDQIERILSSDQALASRLLKAVNSSFYGLPGRVSSIPRAVIILGHATVRNYALGTAAVERIGAGLPASRRQAFWSHALATAAGAEVLARRLGLPDPDEAFVAGLLHDIGHLILMLALPEAHGEAGARGLLGDVVAERSDIGVDHCRAGRQLLRHWKLPAPLLECVRLHHAGEACTDAGNRLLTVVALADRLTRVIGCAGEAPAADEDVFGLIEATGLEAPAVLALIPDLRSRMAAAATGLGLSDDDAVAPAAVTGPARRPGVVISGDPRRGAWLDALARHHGLDVRDLRDWLSDRSAQAETTVICDWASVEPAQAARLVPLLGGGGVELRHLGASAIPAPYRGQDCVRLAPTFSAADLGLSEI